MAFSQHRNQAFVIVAEVGEGYIDYLEGDGSDAAENETFLKLYAFGPFDIFHERHIFALARIMLAFTIQMSMDMVESQEGSLDVEMTQDE